MKLVLGLLLALGVQTAQASTTRDEATLQYLKCSATNGVELAGEEHTDEGFLVVAQWGGLEKHFIATLHLDGSGNVSAVKLTDPWTFATYLIAADIDAATTRRQKTEGILAVSTPGGRYPVRIAEIECSLQIK